MRISMGYPRHDAERLVITRSTLTDPVSNVDPVISTQDHATLGNAVDLVRMDDAVVDYLMEIVHRTRASELLSLGVGPRGGMALHRAARALALIHDRDYCLVDDVKALAVPVLAHRVVAAAASYDGSDSRMLASRAIREITASVEIPL